MAARLSPLSFPMETQMKILKIDHLGIAVNNMNEGKSFWSDILGLTFEGAETVAEQKVTTAFSR